MRGHGAGIRYLVEPKSLKDIHNGEESVEEIYMGGNIEKSGSGYLVGCI